MSQTDVLEGVRNHREVFAAELEAAEAAVEAVIRERPESFALEDLGLKRGPHNTLAFSEQAVLGCMNEFGQRYGFTARISGGQGGTLRCLMLSYESDDDQRTVQLPRRS
jgi:hypothetical protein